MSPLLVIFLLTVLPLFNACYDDGINEIVDNEDAAAQHNDPSGDFPIPGNNGVIVTSSVNANSVTLQWTSGSDDSTPKNALRYRLYRSLSNNIITANDVINNGSPVTDWYIDTRTAMAEALDHGKTYYFNVLVKDGDDHVSAYNTTSATTRGVIYIFSVGSFKGDMVTMTAPSAREELDAKCATLKEEQQPQLNVTHVKAFISISDMDSIKNFPAIHGLPLDWPVKSPDGTLVAYSFSDLMDGTINKTLQDAGVSPSSWWSGSLQDGRYDDGVTCSDWTSASPLEKGRIGEVDSLNTEWLYGGKPACRSTHELICICW
ncbi:MAG: hypothetical protein ACOCWZ_05615 [Spirochaetota bacterium]